MTILKAKKQKRFLHSLIVKKEISQSLCFFEMNIEKCHLDQRERSDFQGSKN